MMDICTPDFVLLEMLKEVAPEGENSDFIDALVVGLDMLERKVGSRGYSKRIFLVTDAGGDVNKDDIARIVKTLKDKDIRLNVIGIDFEEHIEKSEEKEENETLIRHLCDAIQGVVVSVKEAQGLVQFYVPPKSQGKSVFTGVLDFGQDLNIPVVSFEKTSESKVKSLLKLSRLADDSDKPGSMRIITERTYRPYDEPEKELSVKDLVNGYKFGRTIVPVRRMDELNTKLRYTCSPCLKLIGFTDRSQVPRSYYASSVQCLFAPFEDDVAVQALAAIVKAMHETDSVAIVRYVKNTRSGAQLGVLTPQVKEDRYFFYHIKLPFAEDIRQYTFSSLMPGENTVNSKFIYKPVQEQLDTMEDYINLMDLMEAAVDEEGSPMESLKPKHTHSPSAQNFYQCIQYRSSLPKNPLPKLDPTIESFIKPNRILVEKSQDVLTRMTQQFPLKRRTDEDSLEKKRFWDETFGHIDDEVTLESRQEDDSAKKAKKEDKEKPGLSLHALISGGTEQVGSITPTQDFSDMLQRRDVDLVDKAIEQMRQHILKFVIDSIRDSHYAKAMECLIALRKGCIQEDEPDQFNAFLHEMKTLFKDKSRNDFWQLVNEQGISLIHRGESISSKVEKEESEAFFKVDNVKSQDETDEKDPDTADNAEDLLDFLE